MIGIKIGENISVLGDYRRNQITRTAHKFVQVSVLQNCDIHTSKRLLQYS